MKKAIAISILLMPSLAFASTINGSKAVGVLYVIGMALCVIIGAIAYQKRRRLINYRYQVDNSRLGPRIQFELNFVLFLRRSNGIYYLPSMEKDELKIVDVRQSDLHDKVKNCFRGKPELFFSEKAASRLYKSEKDMPPIEPGTLPFKMPIRFGFIYRAALDPIDGKMVSLLNFEDGLSFKTNDIISLKKSVTSVLKQKPELIASEIKAGRLMMVEKRLEN